MTPPVNTENMLANERTVRARCHVRPSAISFFELAKSLLPAAARMDTHLTSSSGRRVTGMGRSLAKQGPMSKAKNTAPTPANAAGNPKRRQAQKKKHFGSR